MASQKYAETPRRKIENYQDFKNVTKPLSHFEIRREYKIKTYFHHYLVLGISQVKDDVDAVTVAHYTSSFETACGNSSSLGQFKRATFFLNNTSGKSADGDNELDLFDFQNLYYIDEPKYPKTVSEVQEAFGRLEKRMGEQNYQLNWNNCESAVNFILTGESKSNQVTKSRTFVDMFGAMIVDIKDVGFRMALFVSALAAIAGSLVRRAYVRIIIAAIVSYGAEMALNSNCLNGDGSNLIEEAKKRIKQAESMPDVSRVIDADGIDILGKIQLHLNHSGFICDLTENLAKEARDKTFNAALLVSFGLETVIYMSYICFNLLPLSDSLTRLEFVRIIVLHMLAGYLSLFLAAWSGVEIGFNKTRCASPALCFFLSVFIIGLILRYALTMFVGILFDLLTGTSCGYNWPYCRCECSCCNCWSKLYKYCRMEEFYVRFIPFVIVLVVGVVCVAYFTIMEYII